MFSVGRKLLYFVSWSWTAETFLFGRKYTDFNVLKISVCGQRYTQLQHRLYDTRIVLTWSGCSFLLFQKYLSNTFGHWLDFRVDILMSTLWSGCYGEVFRFLAVCRWWQRQLLLLPFVVHLLITTQKWQERKVWLSVSNTSGKCTFIVSTSHRVDGSRPVGLCIRWMISCI